MPSLIISYEPLCSVFIWVGPISELTMSWSIYAAYKIWWNWFLVAYFDLEKPKRNYTTAYSVEIW